jgi:hypothetical protein
MIISPLRFLHPLMRIKSLGQSPILFFCLFDRSMLLRLHPFEDGERRIVGAGLRACP